ncbi:MAG: hypothetical protein RIC55_26435 [Pirellulaceae bacterium]
MGKWWLITWTTYASWLPGDPRRYRTWRGRFYVPPPKRFAKEGEPVYQAELHAVKHRMARAASDEEVRFSTAQMPLVFERILEEVDELEIPSAALAVGSQHVHWVALFAERRIRLTVGRMKAKVTERLKDAGFSAKRTWTKGCDMKSKTAQRDLEAAIDYVSRHEQEGCLVKTWPVDPELLPVR